MRPLARRRRVGRAKRLPRVWMRGRVQVAGRARSFARWAVSQARRPADAEALYAFPQHGASRGIVRLQKRPGGKLPGRPGGKLPGVSVMGRRIISASFLGGGSAVD